MPRIDVNLDGGLNTQDDTKRVGFNGFTILQNVRHANGKLIKRFGTGSATTKTTQTIDNMTIFVHRKLSGFKVKNTSTNNVVFAASDSSLTISGTMNTSNIHAPGFDATDLRSMFKPGDSVYLKYSTTCDNDGEVYVIDTVPAANKMTFLAPVTDETLNTSSQNFTIRFPIADYDDTYPVGITIADANSFDGRAFLTSYSTTTNSYISMINPLDYSQNTILEDFGSGTSDMHIRPKAYADAVRFACGLEHSPRIFRYVNRHFFNGIFKTGWNSDADLLYPRWIIDKAVPEVSATTIIQNAISVSSTLNTNENLYELDGTLDLDANNYKYKFIPVYDGVQEELLENPVLEARTTALQKKTDEPSGILSPSKSALKIEAKIDTRQLNPRTSALNVYRSTNDGTFFKIKSIYMGDNDQNQKSLDFYGADDALWFTGDNSPSTSALDSAELIVDGFRFGTENGNTDNNYQSTGYHMVETDDSGSGLATEFGQVVKDDSHMSPGYYGSYYLSKWNKKCEATESIYANNGEAIGGSADGGWYFGGAEALDTIDGGTDIISTSITLTQNDTSTAGPFTTAYGTGNSGDGSYSPHLKFDGFSDDDMKKWRLGGSGGVTADQKYIISGWIRAEGFNNSDAKWRLFVSDSDGHNQYSAEGLQDIANGVGGDKNQNIDKWRWFQYEVTPTATTLRMYLYTNVPNSGCGSATIYVKGLSVRPTIDDYDFSDNMVGFCGKNVGLSSAFKDLGFGSGTLKGNSIQIHLDNASYPTADYADRTIITDNEGPFIRVSNLLPTVGGGEPATDTFFFGTSNYQFFTFTTGASGNTGRYILMDFYDPGLPDGATHFNDGTKSLDVKFKYATMLNGRQFVGNVKITSDDQDTEEYPNFVMFSDANAPDIIPVTNFIQLQDLQGGEIVGIESLMSDLVVFMTNGIFRISVPSNDPSSWSLVEAHTNIGCLNDKAISKAPNGIYFCSQSSVYFLDSGFQAIPISYPIRDEYQTVAASTPSVLRVHYDVKYNRLYVKKEASTNTTFYMYDIARQVWSTELHAGAEYDEFSLDNNNNTILIETDTNSKIRNAIDTSEYRDAGGTAIAMDVKTGEQELTPYDQNAYIRRVNTNTNKGGGTELDLSVIAGTTVTKSDYLDGAQSTRTSQRAQKAQIQISDDVNQDNIKEISKIDVEYE